MLFAFLTINPENAMSSFLRPKRRIGFLRGDFYDRGNRSTGVERTGKEEPGSEK
jgi:hypothetical protein